jgi:threonine/homoserine/homoserine lactone efflux protein
MLALFTAALISFLGQLPFGNMNITATQLAVQEGLRKAWHYALGIVLIEIIYLRLALSAMDWLVQHQRFFYIINWVAAVVFFALGTISFIMAYRQKAESKGLLLQNNLPRFLLGISVSAINPAQIPFWFFWSTSMVQSGIVQTNFSDFNFFTIGAAVGSLAGLAAYMYGGKWLIQRIKASNKQINIVIGSIFIIAALYQVYQLLK